MTETVNHPQHYNSSNAKCSCGRTIECLSVVRYLNFNLGNVVKYIWRHEHKGGIEDLKKALFYLQDEINRLDKPRKSTNCDYSEHFEICYKNPSD